MIEKIYGIVVDKIKYSDSHNIITLFTRQRGRVALFSAVGSSRSAKIRSAGLQPLAAIETDINFRNNDSMPRLGSFSTIKPWKTIYFDPYKRAISLFITEFLNKYLRDAAPDPILWDFTINAINILDSSTRKISNFHIAFLLRMLPLAGIEPSIDNANGGGWLDMRAGTTLPYPPAHPDYLNPEQTLFLENLLKMNFRNFHLFEISSATRREIISYLLKYYAIHFPLTSSLKSPEILHDLFS